MFQDIISYRGALVKFNENNFKRLIWAYPKKGTAGYNQIQHLRKGEEVKPATTVAELTKPEEPIVLEKKKEEKPKKEKKAKKAKKSKKEEIPKNEMVKVEVPATEKNETSGLKKKVYSKVEPMSASLLLALLDKLAVIVKKAETSGYGATADGKALLEEYSEARKPLEVYDAKEVILDGKTYHWGQSTHPRNVLKKENNELFEKVMYYNVNRIRDEWNNRIYEESEEARVLTISQTSICETGYTATKKEVVAEDGLDVWNKMVAIAKLNGKGQAVIFVGKTETDSGDGDHLKFDIEKAVKYKEPVLNRPAPANITKIMVYEIELNTLGDTYTKAEFLKYHTEADWNKAISLSKGEKEVVLPMYGGITAGDEGNIKVKMLEMLN